MFFSIFDVIFFGGGEVFECTYKNMLQSISRKQWCIV